MNLYAVITYNNNPSPWRCWKSFFFVHRSQILVTSSSSYKSPLIDPTSGLSTSLGCHTYYSLFYLLSPLFPVEVSDHNMSVASANEVMCGMLKHHNTAPRASSALAEHRYHPHGPFSSPSQKSYRSLVGGTTDMTLMRIDRSIGGIQPPARSPDQLRPVSKTQILALFSSPRLKGRLWIPILKFQG